MNNNNSIYNIKLKRKIITPNQLIKELPLDNKLKLFIEKTKKEIINILNGTDTRKILIIGPCSIHNIESAKEYSQMRKNYIDEQRRSQNSEDDELV